MRLQVRRNARYVATLVFIGGIVGASTVRAQTVTQAPPPAASPAPYVIEDDVAPYSTALGHNVLSFDTAATYGYYNTGLGRYALSANTSGSWNTATGDWALATNTSGNLNTATGASALYSNTMGDLNTATGAGALQGNTLGGYNTATGVTALYANTTGFYNTATGARALLYDTTGSYNTATGLGALTSNRTGAANTAIGAFALDQATGNLNTAVGYNAGDYAQGSNNIYLGADVLGTAADNNGMRLGRPYDVTYGIGQNQTFIAGIYGTALPAGGFVPVYINAAGQLGTALASPAVNGGQPTGMPRRAVATTTGHARSARGDRSCERGPAGAAGGAGSTRRQVGWTSKSSVVRCLAGRGRGDGIYKFSRLSRRVGGSPTSFSQSAMDRRPN
jgi:hypothetical protein